MMKRMIIETVFSQYTIWMSHSFGDFQVYCLAGWVITLVFFVSEIIWVQREWHFEVRTSSAYRIHLTSLQSCWKRLHFHETHKLGSFYWDSIGWLITFECNQFLHWCRLWQSSVCLSKWIVLLNRGINLKDFCLWKIPL